jgi:crossover junction endodeoxyribonuclease RuvC
MAKRCVVGVDPGLSGALAALDENSRLIKIWDVPSITVKRGKKHRRVIQTAILAGIFREIHAMQVPTLIALEFVRSMPNQGIAGAFTFGQGFGMMEMGAAAFELPIEYITPVKWKKAMLAAGSGTDKQASIVRALQVCPAAAPYLTLKRHEGRAEAILLATFALRTLKPQN